jgi:hypothetical protein
MRSQPNVIPVNHNEFTCETLSLKLQEVKYPLTFQHSAKTLERGSKFD